MNNILQIILATLIALFLPSCVQQGNLAATQSQTLSQLKKGVSTKKDVHKTLGQPHNVYSISNGSQWSYYHVTSKMNGLGLIPVAGLFLPDSNNTSAVAQLKFDSKQRYQTSKIHRRSMSQNSLAGVGRAFKSFSNEEQTERVKSEMKRLGLPFSKSEATKAKDARVILGNDPQL